MSTSPSLSTEKRNGIVNAVSAYLMWGIAPLYFKLLTDVGADEILVHRVIWSSLLLLLVVIAMKKWPQVKALMQEPKLLFRLTLTAVILASNWFLFIWAINNDHLLDASLGYYINPLLSVALGMIFLGERLRKWQKFAVILAIIGVLIQLVMLGSLPVISLALAGTFGVYGLLRKKMQVDSFVGLLVESSLMVPIALLYWGFFISSPTTDMFSNSLSLNVTLVMAGVVTTAPLLCFTAAAKRLTLSALGFFQYIGPSIMFVLATVLYNEPLQTAKLTTFVFIWLALVIFSYESFRGRKATA
ncbi:EamA family transporter RarD [Thalassomonas actiniarum]|uniref:EamA family transporter RarD n=1 Tax=Thalassomonas actiniarum TaxID=485447 RepID=A0AAE9YQ44_9GAMM|nr:EamA family transporter RarD [Thalassomonas actiniarum]WDD99000.1 EamA family transporter RarD [Thalassomonas actiniarum]